MNAKLIEQKFCRVVGTVSSRQSYLIDTPHPTCEFRVASLYCDLWLNPDIFWSKAKGNSNIMAVGYCLNPLNDSFLKTGHIPSLTEFGIHHGLEIWIQIRTEIMKKLLMSCKAISNNKYYWKDGERTTLPLFREETLLVKNPKCVDKVLLGCYG